MNTKKVILLSILLFLTGFVLKTLFDANVFKRYLSAFDGEISVIDSPPGVEDITIDAAHHRAFMGAHDRRNFHTRGDIYIYDLDKPEPEFKKVSGSFAAADFRPHGISLYSENDSTQYLFVVSHGNTEHTIERFIIEGDSLRHLNTFRSELFTSPNDVHAVSPTEFYLTNDHDEKPSFKRSMQDFMQQPTGNVVFFDGNAGKIVAEKIVYANGINSLNNAREVVVASTVSKKLLFFERLSDNSLQPKKEIQTSVGVDNIEPDEAGNLWVGCHPQMLKFLGHAKDAAKLSPSSVIKVNPQTDEVTTVLVDDGSKLSGCSVAAPFGKNNFLAGSVFEPKILRATWRP